MNRAVVTISPDAGILALARVLRTNGISGVPVVDSRGQLVGSVSETDLLFLGEQLLPPLVPLPAGALWQGVHDKTVRDIMSQQVYGLGPDAELEDLLAFFSDTGLHRAFIQEAGRVVGVVSISDLLELVDLGTEGGEEV